MQDQTLTWCMIRWRGKRFTVTPMGPDTFFYIRNELRKTNPTTKSPERPGLDALSILSLSGACFKQKYLESSFGKLLCLGIFI